MDIGIIDFHAHIYPEKIADRAVESVGEFYGIPMDCDGTANALISKGEKCGAVGYVVQSVALTPSRVEAINDYIAMECEAHKEFYGFGTIHADFENKIEETERMISLGLKGVKIHPDTQRFDMDDPKMFELYDFLRAKDMPILIHTGDYRYDFSHPRRLKNILKQFPGLKAIGAHFGGWSLFDLALEYLKDTDCFVDTSSSFWMLGAKRAKELILEYGAERVLFGTDFPMWDMEVELDRFDKMNLPNDERQLILHKNAEKLLRIGEN